MLSCALTARSVPGVNKESMECRNLVEQNPLRHPFPVQSRMAGPSEIEQPSGVEQEAQLLSEFAEIPGISAAWVTPGGQSTKQITVSHLASLACQSGPSRCIWYIQVCTAATLHFSKHQDCAHQLDSCDGLSLVLSLNRALRPDVMQAQYAQRDIPANKLRKYLRTFSVPEDPKGPVESNPSFPLEMKDVLVHSVSPSGTSSPSPVAQSDE